jgi:hypothetical protein
MIGAKLRVIQDVFGPQGLQHSAQGFNPKKTIRELREMVG